MLGKMTPSVPKWLLHRRQRHQRFVVVTRVTVCARQAASRCSLNLPHSLQCMAVTCARVCVCVCELCVCM